MAHENLNAHPHGASQHERGQDESSTTSEPTTTSATRKSNRGFASMDREKQREIASKGGRAAHEKGTAHQFTTDEAREAGRKGGGTVSQDRQHMAEIGRIGGQARGRKQRAATTTPQNGENRSQEPQGDANAAPTEKASSDYRH